MDDPAGCLLIVVLNVEAILGSIPQRLSHRVLRQINRGFPIHIVYNIQLSTAISEASTRWISNCTVCFHYKRHMASAVSQFRIRRPWMTWAFECEELAKPWEYWHFLKYHNLIGKGKNKHVSLYHQYHQWLVCATFQGLCQCPIGIANCRLHQHLELDWYSGAEPR